MSFTGFQGSERFFSLTRQTELVILSGRDAVAFIPDVLPFDATKGMSIWRDSSKSEIIYQSTPLEDVVRKDRCLWYARVFGNKVFSSFRWVPYVVGWDINSSQIRPLREVYAPRVNYDSTSNQLTLWFWTNVKRAYTGTDYDESQLCPVGYLPEDFNAVSDSKLALCFTTGVFRHCYVEGGWVSGYSGQGVQDGTVDIVPVFRRPQIIPERSGIAERYSVFIDGWNGGFQDLRGPQGAQGFQGFQGFQGSQGHQGFQGPVGFMGPATGAQGPQGPRGPQGPQGPTGEDGAPGFPGDEGYRGLPGVQGATGPTGNQGPQGSMGAQGPQGLQGINGDTGLQGPFQCVACFTAGKYGAITNSYLKMAGEVTTETLAVAYNGVAIAMSASCSAPGIWYAQVYKNGSLFASLYLYGVTSAYSVFSSPYSFSQGDRFCFYCNGTAIDDPVIAIYVRWDQP